MLQTDETQLVQKARSGDRDAFTQLYRRHVQRVYAVVVSWTRDRDLADDLVQVAFVRAYERLGGFRCEAAFSTWMTRIALNVCYSHYQAEQARQRWTQAFEVAEISLTRRSEDPEDVLFEKERRELVMREIRSLPEDCRSVMWLRYVEDYSYAEIQAELDLPMGTVKTWLWRGRQVLKGSFQESGAQMM